MKDKGIDKGLVSKFETSSNVAKGKFGFRKLFWDYLKKLNVAFADECCDEANGDANIAPTRFKISTGELQFFEGGVWVTVLTSTTTTTTTAAPTTTTTTTAAPTTTTTTTAAPTTTTTTTI